MCEKEGVGAFIERNSDEFHIRVGDKKEHWRTLRVCEFTSERRMMSRVV